MNFDDWLATFLTPEQLNDPKNVIFGIDDVREAWAAAMKTGYDEGYGDGLDTQDTAE